ncbi:adenylate kinase-domain-containing protein [Globomyces pollinis-pini]|nr:adenylate kinase-domain-containing protein [Globomyces pollinis-pini]
MSPFRALILGCPGSGKGTQTKRILKEYPKIKTLASGDMLRDQIYRKTDHGLKIKEMISNGELVPDTFIYPMMIDHIHQVKNHHWLLDGFPRTISQAKHLDQDLNNPITMVLNLDVPWNVILNRIEERWIHAPSGRTYNLSFNPPKQPGVDDLTGEPLTKRPDDCPISFKVRLEQYEKLTMPLIEYYEKQGILFNFKGETSDQITPQIFEQLEKFHW